MVVITREQQQQSGARGVVRSLGVDDAVLDAAEDANRDLDWMKVIYALDGVFLARGGAMGQVYFLSARLSELRGRTPIEILSETGGPAEFCRAAQRCASN